MRKLLLAIIETKNIEYIYKFIFEVPNLSQEDKEIVKKEMTYICTHQNYRYISKLIDINIQFEYLNTENKLFLLDSLKLIINTIEVELNNTTTNTTTSTKKTNKN